MRPAGFLNFLKPPGMTSHDVVQWVRRLLGERRVGHAGTLDPAAAGVLVLGVGNATRLLEYAAAGRKEYRAEVTFGIATATQDAEGEVLARRAAGWLTPGQVEAALGGFVGRIAQVPPLYSAVHHQGERLYRLARNGQQPEVPPRPVEVYGIRLLRWQGGEYPHALLEVTCGPGTYIRTLAADLGERLGCGAHLSFLVRTASGGFRLAESCSPGELEAGRERWLLPPLEALSYLPRLVLGPAAAERVRHGRDIPLAVALPAGSVACLLEEKGNLLAVGRVRQGEGGLAVHPEKVFDEW